MKEYISKDEAKLALAKEFSYHSYAGGAACKVIDNLPAADVMERLTWIKVMERLPEKQGTYLIYTANGKVVSASFTPLFQKFNGIAGKSCTHWMELPIGPEGEGRDGTATIDKQRMCVLPTRMGETVWAVMDATGKDPYIVKCKLVKMSRQYNEKPVYSCSNLEPNAELILEYYEEDFGKEVFLTREQAEEWLRNRQSEQK